METSNALESSKSQNKLARFLSKLVSNIIPTIFPAYADLDSKTYKTYRNISILAIINICFLICVFTPFAVYSSDVSQFDIEQTLPTLASLFGIFLLASALLVYITSFFYRTRLLKIGTYGVSVILCIGLIYTFVLDFNIVTGESYGAMEAMMFLDTTRIYHLYNKYIDFGVGILLCIMVLFFMKHVFIMINFLKILFPTLAIVSSISLYHILVYLPDDSIDQGSKQSPSNDHISNPNPHISAYSKDHLNIVVLMLDAFTGSHFKILLEENPGLQDKLDGFVYYDNTTTAASFTHTSIPSVFGGDYYSAHRINERKKGDLESERHDSFITISNSFVKNGFLVGVNAYAIDTSRVTAHMSNSLREGGGGERFNIMWDKKYNIFRFKHLYHFDLENELEKLKDAGVLDSLIAYGLFKYLPYILRARVLNLEETRWELSFGDKKTSVVALGRAADHIAQLSTIVDDTHIGVKQPTFKFIASLLSHDSFVLDIENCKPSAFPKPMLPDRYRDLIPQMFWGKYNSQMCAFRQITHLIDQLKNLQVYDNTLFVIVSDHGRADSYPQLKVAGKNFPGYYTDTLLMIKEPKSHGKLQIDSRLMINSDVAGIICSYAGGCKNVGENILKNYPKDREVVHFYPEYFQGEKNPKTHYQMNSLWKVKGNIYEPSNWQRLE